MAPSPSCHQTLPPAAARRNRRVEQYRGVVRPLALHYARCSRESFEDLLQVGLLGLIRAAELYKEERRTPFEAFARPHIRGAILHYLRDAAPMVRLPRRQAELQERFNRLSRHPSLLEDPGRAITLLSGALGVTPAEWRRLELQRLLARPANLDDPSFLEAVASQTTSEPCLREEPGPSAAMLLELLDPRTKLVVRQVVLAGWSYRRLGRQMDVSPMTVKRLLHKGLEQLRRELDARGLTPGDRPDRGASAAQGC
ncbi:sigma-70 family RNA polymerase sigma factor [Cyanobium gracile]|uniref:RNA polymerase sigma factor, sigma-70 family n=1 Tax=Cyanobium gracile (strain ATCC 27147 / PCC 6307) TaxID=292564 RepID=K9P430_CYAGP|nr:sigma-70 family RNA polymerase sigma factor [Cyanobium gracile]AFY27748.1 RNA polymerase sigma factor, sigma-70 family [Cyanobium gracile PCC 6307]